MAWNQSVTQHQTVTNHNICSREFAQKKRFPVNRIIDGLNAKKCPVRHFFNDRWDFRIKVASVINNFTKGTSESRLTKPRPLHIYRMGRRTNYRLESTVTISIQYVLHHCTGLKHRKFTVFQHRHLPYRILREPFRTHSEIYRKRHCLYLKRHAQFFA